MWLAPSVSHITNALLQESTHTTNAIDIKEAPVNADLAGQAWGDNSDADVDAAIFQSMPTPQDAQQESPKMAEAINIEATTVNADLAGQAWGDDSNANANAAVSQCILTAQDAEDAWDSSDEYYSEPASDANAHPSHSLVHMGHLSQSNMPVVIPQLSITYSHHYAGVDFDISIMHHSPPCLF